MNELVIILYLTAIMRASAAVAQQPPPTERIDFMDRRWRRD